MSPYPPSEQGAFLVGEGEFGRILDRCLVRGGMDFANRWAELPEDVVDGLDQPGAVAEQAVAASGGQAVHGTGHRKDLAACFMAWWAVDSDPLRGRGLDHDHAET